MSPARHGLTVDQVLDELEAIAALEHAHCVYYLRLQCALDGHASDPTGVIPAGVRQAAQASFQIAFQDMFHLRDVNRALVRGGRDPSLARATEVAAGSARPIDLEAFTPAQFARFPRRETALAKALDSRYARVARALASRTPPPLSDELLGEVRLLLNAVTGEGMDHQSRVPALTGALAGLTPADYLRVTGVAPADDLDTGLLALSAESYGSLLALLRDHFHDVDLFGPGLAQHAAARMESLDKVNALLGIRGLLPPFPAP